MENEPEFQVNYYEPKAKSGVLSRVWAFFKKIEQFIGPKLLFTLLAAGLSVGTYTFLNITADMNPEGDLASLRASAGLPSFRSDFYSETSNVYEDCLPSNTQLHSYWIGCYFVYPASELTVVPAEQNVFTKGNFKFSRKDKDIDFDWYENGESVSPNPSISSSYFAVRWLREESFSKGDYKFSVFADEKVRVFIDGTVVYNNWAGELPGEHVFYKSLDAGLHKIVVEYLQSTGRASVRFSWEAK